MRVHLGPYKYWFGPYQLAELITYLGFSEDTAYKLGSWLCDGYIEKFLNWISSKRKRKIVVKIDKYDTWGMYESLAVIIAPMLRQLRDTKVSFPLTDNKDVPPELRTKKKRNGDIDDNAEVAKNEKARAAYLTPIVKGWCTEVAQEVTSLGVQVHGGMGFIEETGAAQHFRDARILPIYEGTNGIQALDLVGRKTLMDQGNAARSIIEEMKATLNALQGSAKLSALTAAFADSIETLSSATHYLLENSAQDAQLSASIAYNYLMMTGTVCGAWQLLRGGVAAEQLQQAGETDPYLESKIRTAKFYVDQILPRYSSYAAMAFTGSSAIMSFTDEHLSSSFQ